MAYNPYAPTPGMERDAERDRYDLNQLKRSDKAKAFRDYVDAKTKAGETVDPYELDRVRLELVGGDPYLGSYIPAGDALKTLTDRANEKASLSRMQVGADMIETNKGERDNFQTIIDDNWDKTPDDIAKTLTDSFGPEQGAKIFARYKSELPGMLNQATAKKYAEIAADPTSKMILTEKDAATMRPLEWRDPKTRPLMQRLVEENSRARNQQNATAMATVISSLPESAKSNPDVMKAYQNLGAQIMGENNIDGLTPEARTQMNELLYGAARQDAQGKYDKQKAAYKATFMEQAEAVEKGGKDRASAALTSAFYDMKKYGVKQGNKVVLDPRVQSAMDAIQLNATFFPSDDNVRNAASFLKQLYDSDPKGFDPGAASEEFLATGNFDSKADWLDNNAEEAMEASGFGIDPKTSFRAWSSKKELSITQEVEQLQQVWPATAPEDRAVILNALRSELSAYNMVVTDIYNDPAKRMAYPDFDYNAASQSIKKAQETIRLLEKAATPSPAAVAPQPERPQGYAPTPRQPTNDGGWISLERQYGEYVPSPTDNRLQRGVGALQNAMVAGNRAFDTLLTPLRKVEEAPVNILYQAGRGAGVIYDWLTEVPPQPSDIPTHIAPEYRQPPQQEQAVNGYQPISYQPPSNNERLQNFLDVVADIESNGNPNAKAATSSAKGLFQFTNATWKEVVSKYGAQHGITQADIYDPKAQRLMAAYFTRDNAMTLMQKTGKRPSESDLYLAHFLGAAGAATLINNIGTGQLAAQVFPAAAASNKSLFYDKGEPLTIEEFYAKMSNKVTKRMKKTQANQKADNTFRNI